MILTMTVELYCAIDFEGEWTGTIEIDGGDVLDDLHGAIQIATDFDNDHLYQFYIAPSMHGKIANRVVFDDSTHAEGRLIFDDDNNPHYEEGEEIANVFNTTIDSLFPLGKHRKLFYYFDFGDSWIFRVNKVRKKAFEPQAGVEYPRLIGETGKKPVQYPDWEE